MICIKFAQGWKCSWAWERPTPYPGPATLYLTGRLLPLILPLPFQRKSADRCSELPPIWVLILVILWHRWRTHRLKIPPLRKKPFLIWLSSLPHPTNYSPLYYIHNLAVSRFPKGWDYTPCGPRLYPLQLWIPAPSSLSRPWINGSEWLNVQFLSLAWLPCKFVCFFLNWRFAVL